MITPAKYSDLGTVRNITHNTIREIYVHYYPKGAVEFFLAHHNDAAICRDIAETASTSAVIQKTFQWVPSLLTATK